MWPQHSPQYLGSWACCLWRHFTMEHGIVVTTWFPQFDFSRFSQEPILSSIQNRYDGQQDELTQLQRPDSNPAPQIISFISLVKISLLQSDLKTNTPGNMVYVFEDLLFSKHIFLPNPSTVMLARTKFSWMIEFVVLWYCRLMWHDYTCPVLWSNRLSPTRCSRAREPEMCTDYKCSFTVCSILPPTHFTVYHSILPCVCAFNLLRLILHHLA